MEWLRLHIKIQALFQWARLNLLIRETRAASQGFMELLKTLTTNEWYLLTKWIKWLLHLGTLNNNCHQSLNRSNLASMFRALYPAQAAFKYLETHNPNNHLQRNTPIWYLLLKESSAAPLLKTETRKKTTINVAVARKQNILKLKYNLQINVTLSNHNLTTNISSSKVLTKRKKIWAHSSMICKEWI